MIAVGEWYPFTSVGIQDKLSDGAGCEVPMTDTVDAAAVASVLSRLESDREELSELVLDLANTYGPVGYERVTAEEIDRWYRRNGLDSRIVDLTGQRANVVARLPGTGRDPSLLSNAHLDTEASGPDFEHLMQVPDPDRVDAWREGGRIFSHTALDDRHAHALFMFPARAIQQAGIPLAGDLVLTSVAGETGQAPVDEPQRLDYEGKGFGTSYPMEHGVRADYALIAETTGFALCWHHCGANYHKVKVRGQNMYTPRLDHDRSLQESPSRHQSQSQQRPSRRARTRVPWPRRPRGHCTDVRAHGPPHHPYDHLSRRIWQSMSLSTSSPSSPTRLLEQILVAGLSPAECMHARSALRKTVHMPADE